MQHARVSDALDKQTHLLIMLAEGELGA